MSRAFWTSSTRSCAISTATFGDGSSSAGSGGAGGAEGSTAPIGGSTVGIPGGNDAGVGTVGSGAACAKAADAGTTIARSATAAAAIDFTGVTIGQRVATLQSETVNCHKKVTEIFDLRVRFDVVGRDVRVGPQHRAHADALGPGDVVEGTVTDEHRIRGVGHADGGQ